jgi:uncharacterized protein YjbI with pentapeptide repeats
MSTWPSGLQDASIMTRDRRRPATQADIELALGTRRRDRPNRIRLEGVVLGDRVQRAGVVGVDFVDCDLTALGFDKPRFGRQVVVEDCTFTDCTWIPELASTFSHVTFRSCRFEGAFFRTGGGTKCIFEDCTITGSQIGDASLEDCVLRRVAFVDVRLRKVHWQRCTFEEVVISGEARTLVITDARYRSLDLSGLRMADCDLGLPLEARDVVLPASPDLFVVSEASLDLVVDRLATSISRRAVDSYRAMIQAVYGPMVVIDRSMFTPAPDLPGMETTPVEVDIIMSELWQHHIARVDQA